MKKFFSEFKEFINRGNVMDLAVAVIIGGAFTSIVTALTTNIINPLISVIAGGGADTISGLVVPGTDIDFGAFISACINFLIVAFVVFLLVKAVNAASRSGQQASGQGRRGPPRLRPCARIKWRKSALPRVLLRIAPAYSMRPLRPSRLTGLKTPQSVVVEGARREAAAEDCVPWW